MTGSTEAHIMTTNVTAGGRSAIFALTAAMLIGCWAVVMYFGMFRWSLVDAERGLGAVVLTVATVAALLWCANECGLIALSQTVTKGVWTGFISVVLVGAGDQVATMLKPPPAVLAPASGHAPRTTLAPAPDSAFRWNGSEREASPGTAVCFASAVDSVFARLLGGLPSVTDREEFAGQLAGGGLRLRDVVRQELMSDEYYQRFVADSTPRNVTLRLYRIILGRTSPPAEADLRGHLEKYAVWDKRTAFNVDAAEFIGSREYVQHVGVNGVPGIDVMRSACGGRSG
jgi:hypothetical protein